MRTSILFGCILFWNALPGFGMERPSAVQLESYRKDGTLQNRIEAAKAIGNQKLEARGTAEKTEGKVERKVGDVKKVFGK